jgi:hypothetical protein
MAWCDDCSKFWPPAELTAEGACPACARVLSAEPVKVPWHFKLLVVAVAVYLGYRTWQGLAWLAHHL